VEGWPTAPEAVGSRPAEVNCPKIASEVPSVVGTAAPFIDSFLRVWAKGAGHVDEATFVDSGGADRFWGLVLFAPAFECSELIELIGAGPSPTVIHPRDHKKTKPVTLIRAHVFQDGLVIRDGIQGGDRAVGTSVAPTVIEPRERFGRNLPLPYLFAHISPFPPPPRRNRMHSALSRQAHTHLNEPFRPLD
jgi:hypothetical protein